MSKPGALTKKELADAGRRKLEEFKRKKQLAKGAAACTGAAEPSPPASAPGAPAPAQAPAAATSIPSSIPAVQTTPASGSALVPASSAPAQPAFEWHGSPGAEATSTAARAAAAGAAAAALEAALMGLPSVPAPAAPPAALSSSSSAALPAEVLTNSSDLHAAAAGSHTSPVHPYTGHTQQQQQQQPPALPSSRMPQVWQQPPVDDLAPKFQQSAGDSDSAAGLQPQAARSLPVSSPPAAKSPAQPGKQQNSSWLSLFGSRSGSAGASGPDHLQQHGQQQGHVQKQEGSSDNSTLPHSSIHTSHPASPGPVRLMPPAGAASPAATASIPAKPPVPWIPGEGAAAAATPPLGSSSTVATGFQQTQWLPGMLASSSSSGANPANLSTAAGAAPDSTTGAPEAASGFSSIADSYLTPAAPASSSGGGAGSVSSSNPKLAADATKPQESGRSSTSMMDQEHQQQPQQPAHTSSSGGTLAAVVAPGGVVGIGSQQGQAAAAAGAALANSLWGSGAINGVSAFASTPAVQPGSSSPLTPGSNYAALADSYLQKATAAGAAAATTLPTPPPLHQQQQQPHIPQQQQSEQLPNGNLSHSGSFSSLPPAPAGAAAMLQEHGPVEKQLLSQHGSAIGLAALGRISSITNSSIPGSGPPSTTGGLSIIQAHAESSQRSVERLKLLQQHIDELTQEKLELMRGLQQQARSNEALAEENRVLGEQHNKLAAQVEREQQKVKRIEQEFAAAAASMAALAAERDAHRAAATEAHDRANSLAAENVALENQLLEAKSACLRIEQEASGSSATIAKLEDKVAKLSAAANVATAELAGLQSERRILKARLMQAEARMRAAGLPPLPPLPSNIGQAEAEAAPPVVKVDAEVQADLQPVRRCFQLPVDVTALPTEVLAIAEGALTAHSTKHLLLDPVKVNHEAAAVLAGLAEWLPRDLVEAAEAAAATRSTGASAAAYGSATVGDDAAAVSAPADAAVASAAVAALAGADVWCEEARLAGSVVGLAQQLQDSWGTVLDEFEHERERNQQLQQEAEELRYQLTVVQQKLHHQQRQQQQLLLSPAHHPQAQQIGETSESHIPVGMHHSSGSAVASQEGQLQQQGSPRHDEHTEQLPLNWQIEQQHADVPQQLPVSVPVHSDAPGTPSHPHHSAEQASAAAAAEAPPAAGVQQYQAYTPTNYAAGVKDTSSVVGSVVGSSLSGTTIGQQWDDSSTASSSRAGSGRSWFGMFGRKNMNRAQSALV